MPTLFSRIIAGELPGRFVWRDAECVAFLSIAPLRPGHTLVVPRAEVDHWVDLPPALAAHLIGVSQQIARGIQAAFPCRKVGVVVAGLEVPHVHIHLSPIDGVHDLDFDRAVPADGPALDVVAAKIRASLTALGRAEATA